MINAIYKKMKLVWTI